MSKYILRRILIFIPTLFIITLFAFIISVNAPGDPVDRMMSSLKSGEETVQKENSKELKTYWKKKLGLDLPLFYFSLHALSTADTLYKIYDTSEKETLERLIYKYGNWKEISAYHTSLLNLEKRLDNNTTFAFLNADKFIQLKYEIFSLKYIYDNSAIESRIKSIQKLMSDGNSLPDIGNIKSNYERIKIKSTPWKNFIPVISFYKHNQYHRWLFGDGVYSKGILRGDFGISYITKQPVSKVIGERIGWSFFFILVAVILAYFISIPVGAKAGSKKDSAFDKVSSITLFVLYSLPVFWVATLLLMTFANPDVLFIFPASGVKPANGFPEAASLFEKIKLTLPYLVLPVICYTYGSLAFLARTMRVSMLEEINRDYVRTARAKGLSESKVIYKHALRNVLFPAITVFANFFPLVISGVVVIETIFTIPGMGLETFIAIQNQNYPMLIAIFTITGMLTLVGYLVSDILYALTDPRISFSK
ncbi:MAG: ABC transporter permease subunit [Bacteroidia bacterium]